MRISWNKTLSKLCEPYIYNLIDRFDNLDRADWPDDLYEVLKQSIAQVDHDDTQARVDLALKAYVDNHNIKYIEDLFEGELKRALVFLLEEEWAEIFCRFTKLEALYPFATGAYRRALRDRNVYLHLRHIMFSLVNFIVLKASGITPEEWVTRWVEFRYESLSLDDLFATMIYHGNETAINYFREALGSEKSMKELSWDHYRAVVKSGNRELVELEGKMLLNARLQEGLRQSIVETADEGMSQSFLILLDTIRENGLERYTSVKRAFGAWTGLGDVAPKEHVTIKQFDLLSGYLHDIRKAYDAIDTDDALALYLALWAIGFYNVPDVEEPVRRIIEEGNPNRVCVALLFLDSIENSDLKAAVAREVLRKYPDELKILAAALPMYLANFYWKTPQQERELELKNPGRPIYDPAKYFGEPGLAEVDFEILKRLYASLDKKMVFDPYVFPWEVKELSKDMVAGKICNLAQVIHTPEMTDRILEFIPAVNPNYRDAVIFRMLSYPATAAQIDFLVDNMGNGTLDTRKQVCEIVERLYDEGALAESHFSKMENLLRLKASETRVSAIKILASRPDKEALDSVTRLLKDKNAMKRFAGLEIAKQWHDKKQRPELIEALRPLILSLPNPDAQEKKMITSITAGTGKKKTLAPVYGFENGFGLYDPADQPDIKATWPADFDVEKALAFENPDEGRQIVVKLMEYIAENADLEFTTSWGEVCRIGDSVTSEYSDRNTRKMKVGRPELWIKFYNEEIKSTANLLRLVFPLFCKEDDKEFALLVKKFLGKAYTSNPYKKIDDAPHFLSAQYILTNLYFHLHDEKVWETVVNLFSDLALRIEPDDVVKKISYPGDDEIDPHTWPVWLENPYDKLDDVFFYSDTFPDDLFRRYFSAGYELYRKSSYMKERYVDMRMPLRPGDFERAWRLGMFTDRQFLQELLGRPYSHYLIDYFTRRLPGAENPRRFKGFGGESDELPAELSILVERAVDRIMDVELKRGSTPTDVSKLACEIECVKGIDNFIGILVALGRDKLTKYSYNDEKSKKEVMSHLLSVCVPSANDKASDLRKKAAEAGISDERLVEAALFSPRWLALVEQAVGWNGLKSGAYYFLAHTADELEDEVKSIIRRYSDVDPDDFAEGAFDPDWFKDVYEALGEERFNVLYRAAKYVSDSNRHTRSRKLADAWLGKIGASELMHEISEKRNKDSVVALGLVPLENYRKADVESRYDYLNKFLKESVKFGAQRQSAEARAVKLSLDNLARNAGYSDSTRLTWNMEAKLVERLSEFILPKEIDGVTVRIQISEGMPEMTVETNGKGLRNIPARLKKDPYITQIKEALQVLKDQHTRGRSLLEKAMNEMMEFSGEEIISLRDNPIIWNMLKRLVLVNESGKMGFPAEDGKTLVTVGGEEVEVLPLDTLRVAHAYDLYKSGEWSAYQKHLYSREWRQPFKQIFRELYLPTTDEKSMTKSLRYAGNQILPQKTAAVLKKRLWTVDYENGLQKTLFNGNLVAVLYAMADWFSPADIENPTLEYVAFYDRRTGEEKTVSEIHPVIFSEIMRDVDLAVSVAHAGGYDPETSGSTIEMRSAIVSHTAALFGLDNVSVSGNFVKIHGKLADYSVHLGSGIVHQEGGAEIAVLPVHSQSRGRIFMPFIDDDPKTAEIITKVLLFSDDRSIKDPSILEQINRK